MVRKICLLCLGLCVLLVQTVLAAPVPRAQYRLSQFHYEMAPASQGEPEILRIELGLNRDGEVFAVEEDPDDPRRLLVQMESTRLGRMKSPIELDGKIGREIEFERIDHANSRAAIVLNKSVSRLSYEIYVLPADKQARKPFRVVIDIYNGKRKTSMPGLIGGKTILLDAGHGGSDTGAIGPTGVREKDVTLRVTKRVEEILQQAGNKVIMTRTGDRDVYGPNASDRDELDARVAVGRRKPADVFVSIHANAFVKPSAHGTATYYYEKTDADRYLAAALQKGMVDCGSRYDRGIHEANFYVVKRSSMPAALVELAFLTNPEEEALLASSDFQEKLAQGISRGISDFFKGRKAKG